jgi:hypothetical protein
VAIPADVKGPGYDALVSADPDQSTGPAGPHRIQLPLNPGSVPEAGQLSQVSDGLRNVRAIVRRETMGAVNPLGQLRAMDAILQTHHDALARLVATVFKKNSGAISADDALRYVVSLTEHIAMASYWLEVARRLPRVPAPSGARRLLSQERSRLRREGILSTIARTRNLAIEVIQQLNVIAAAELPNGGAAQRQLLVNIRISISCAEVHAVVSATGASESGVATTHETLEHYRGELQGLRASDDFAHLDDVQKSDVWVCTAQIAQLLGDTGLVNEALRRSLELSSGDLDAHIRNLVNSLANTESNEERLNLVRRLHRLASDQDLGPVFSRERVGRISMLHDAFDEIAAGVNQQAASAPSLVQECFDTRHRWLFDREAPADNRLIRISSGGQGSGRVAWQNVNGPRITAFDLAPDTAIELVRVTSSPSTSNRPIVEAIDALSVGLGPAIADALNEIHDPRLEVGGVISLLPVMATRLGSVPIGGRPTVAYLHPLTGSLEPSAEPVRAPDLLLLDCGFRKHSKRVATAFRLLHDALGTTPTILEFDRAMSDGNVVNSETAIEALRSATGAIFYGHCHTELARAGVAALLLGGENVLMVDAMAQLDLRNLDSLTLVACASGRPNPFVGSISVAHAAAIAGCRQLLYSLWPITAANGARFTTGLLAHLASGGNAAEYLAALHRTSPLDAAPFGIMRL